MGVKLKEYEDSFFCCTISMAINSFTKHLLFTLLGKDNLIIIIL